MEKELADLPKEPAPVDLKGLGVPELPQEVKEAIAKAQAAASAAQKMLEAKLEAKAPPAAPACGSSGASPETAEDEAMDLDEETTAKVDALLATLGYDLPAAGGNDGGGAKRIELKGELASVVVKEGTRQEEAQERPTVWVAPALLICIPTGALQAADAASMTE